MALRAPDRFARRALALWRDTDGLMVPYVAVMLPVLVGFALLALDGSRRMSLQTQMQAAADSLALAGARELNKQAGAESRAISAMANALVEISAKKAAGRTVDQVCGVIFTATYFASESPVATEPPTPSLAAHRPE